MTLMLEAVHTSETSVYSNKTTLRYIPEGSPLQTFTTLNRKTATDNERQN
jgi:hypothetical protein